MDTRTYRSPAMDSAIWSRLPQDLLDHILCLLPFRDFLKLRSTCKHFHSLMFAPSFVSKHCSSSSSPLSSFLLLCHPQCYHRFPLYDSLLGAWRNETLSFSPLLTCAVGPTLVSTSKGLFCFSLSNPSSLLLCNLLAKSSRVIQFPIYSVAFDLFTLVSTAGGYKIFALCSGSASNKAFVYNSTSHSWREFDGCAPILSHQEGVFYNGHLYFTRTSEPISVMRFDLEGGKWERDEMETPIELTFGRLVSDGEKKMYLVGGIGRNGISRSVKVWELNREGKWEEIERLPELMCRKFMSVCYHNYGHVYCFWHQGMICVCCYTWPEVLYFRVSRGTWHWIPKCPSLPEKWSCGFRWFSFVPQLYASV